MSSQNYFDLLGDDENEEPTAVIARASLPPLVGKSDTAKKPQTATVYPTRGAAKPPPPFEAVKDHRSFEGGREGRGGVRVGRGGRSHGDRDHEGAFQRDSRDGFPRERGSHINDRNLRTSRGNNDTYQGNRVGGISIGSDGVGSRPLSAGIFGDRVIRVDGDTWTSDMSRGRGRGGGRFRDRGVVADSEDRTRRREFDRRSGSGFGNEIKRDGSGRGNWGAEGDQESQQDIMELSKDEVEKVVVDNVEKASIEENLESSTLAEDGAEKEDVETELTLDEYEKILEEKRKALLASKAEERKVQADKAFESMQLVDKKNDDDVFIKLGSDKERKKKEKEALEKEEKAKKTQSINEFLKPADGEKYYGSRVRGRGRGRSGEGRGRDGERSLVGRANSPGGFNSARRVIAPRIEDRGQFPTLGAK